MRKFQILLCLLLLAWPASHLRAQDGAGDAPTEAQVEQAVDALKSAFGKGGTPERIEALDKAEEVVAPEVIQLVLKALKDKDRLVVDRALESLRVMPHSYTLKGLHKAIKSDRRLAKDNELFAKLLKVTGSFADPSSVAILSKDVFSNINRDVVTARLLGLGNIRNEDSLREIFSLLNKASQKNLNPHIDSFRLALMQLTGVDKGKSREEWQRWWNDNKRKLKVDAQAPVLPKKWQNKWNKYWGLDDMEERRKKRDERGKD